MRESKEAIPVPRNRIELVMDEEDGEEFCTWVEVGDDEVMES
jgi:hypothetical protein